MSKTVSLRKEPRPKHTCQPMVYPPTPPRLNAAMDFLNSFFFDEDWETARDQIAGQAAWETDRGVITCRTGVSASRILTGLNAIEALLADPDTEAHVLTWLVEVNAGWGLDHPREEQARDILRQIAEMTREVLGDHQPPRQD